MKTNKKNGININGINVNLGNIADLINEGKIINLLDIPWIALFDKANLLDSTVFGGYAIPHKEIETIIKQIVSDSVKIALIESIQKDCKKHLLPANYLFNETDLQRCLTFLDNLKGDINDYEYYDLQAVKRREKPSIEPKTLSNKQDSPNLNEILNRAMTAGFIECSDGKYKCLKSLTWLAVFADTLNERDFVKDKFGEIETMFGVKNLAQSKNRALGQKNYNKMKLEIEKLFC